MTESRSLAEAPCRAIMVLLRWGGMGDRMVLLHAQSASLSYIMTLAMQRSATLGLRRATLNKQYMAYASLVVSPVHCAGIPPEDLRGVVATESDDVEDLESLYDNPRNVAVDYEDLLVESVVTGCDKVGRSLVREGGEDMSGDTITACVLEAVLGFEGGVDAGSLETGRAFYTVLVVTQNDGWRWALQTETASFRRAGGRQRGGRRGVCDEEEKRTTALGLHALEAQLGQRILVPTVKAERRCKRAGEGGECDVVEFHQFVCKRALTNATIEAFGCLEARLRGRLTAGCTEKEWTEEAMREMEALWGGAGAGGRSWIAAEAAEREPTSPVGAESDGERAPLPKRPFRSWCRGIVHGGFVCEQRSEEALLATQGGLVTDYAQIAPLLYGSIMECACGPEDARSVCILLDHLLHNIGGAWCNQIAAHSNKDCEFWKDLMHATMSMYDDSLAMGASCNETIDEIALPVVRPCAP